MRHRGGIALLLGLTASGLLTACLGESDTSATRPPHAAASAQPAPDAAAQERADAWLAAVELPEGAVAAAEAPAHAPALALQRQDWWCEPMASATGYWTIAGAGVIETANWLLAHPTAGMVVAGSGSPHPEADVDLASAGHVPTADALEGIAFSVARADGGVAVRAEVGAIPQEAACATPAPGEGLGGPGQG